MNWLTDRWIYRTQLYKQVTFWETETDSTNSEIKTERRRKKWFMGRLWAICGKKSFFFLWKAGRADATRKWRVRFLLCPSQIYSLSEFYSMKKHHFGAFGITSGVDPGSPVIQDYKRDDPSWSLWPVSFICPWTKRKTVIPGPTVLEGDFEKNTRDRQ
jgi:hypothetical protein